MMLLVLRVNYMQSSQLNLSLHVNGVFNSQRKVLARFWCFSVMIGFLIENIRKFYDLIRSLLLIYDFHLKF